MSETTYLEAKEKHDAEMTDSITELYRNPADNLLAVGVSLAIFGSFGYEAYALTIAHGPIYGAIVAVFALLSYQIARRGWEVQNSMIAHGLAKRDATEQFD